MAHISETVRRLTEAGHIADTDGARDLVRAKLERLTLMLDVDVPCYEIDTSKLAANESAEAIVVIGIFHRLNSGVPVSAAAMWQPPYSHKRLTYWQNPTCQVR